MPKSRWFVYTVVVGMLPFLARLLAYFFVSQADLAFLSNEQDFAWFALVLSIANINELNRLRGSDDDWRERSILFSAGFIAISAFLLAFSFVRELQPGVINSILLLIAAIFLAGGAFIYSFKVNAEISRDQRRWKS